jgi:hypothetical protein
MSSGNGLGVVMPPGYGGAQPQVNLQLQSPYLERIALSLEAIAEELVLIRGHVTIKSADMKEGEIR